MCRTCFPLTATPAGRVFVRSTTAMRTTTARGEPTRSLSGHCETKLRVETIVQVSKGYRSRDLSLILHKFVHVCWRLQRMKTSRWLHHPKAVKLADWKESSRSSQDRRVIVCPLCDKALPLASGVDENLLFEQHSATCVPKPVKAQVPRCPSKGCKEKLTFSKPGGREGLKKSGVHSSGRSEVVQSPASRDMGHGSECWAEPDNSSPSARSSFLLRTWICTDLSSTPPRLFHAVS